MMVWSINLIVLAIGFLIVGMFRPGWILFWMDKPGRLPIVFLSSGIFMAAVIMFGEANKKNEKLTTAFEMHEKATAQDSVPVVTPETETPAESEAPVQAETVVETKATIEKEVSGEKEIPVPVEITVPVKQ